MKWATGFAVGIVVAVWMFDKLFSMGKGENRGCAGMIVAIGLLLFFVYALYTHTGCKLPCYFDYPWKW